MTHILRKLRQMAEKLVILIRALFACSGRAFEGPTAVLLSAAKTDLYEGVAASPVFSPYPCSLIPENNEGLALVRSLVDSSIELGLPILSLGINDIGELKDAQIHPGTTWGSCSTRMGI